jgi:hypothetical protein
MKRVAAVTVVAVILFAVGFGLSRQGRSADRQPKGITSFSTTYTIWQVDPPAARDGR